MQIYNVVNTIVTVDVFNGPIDAGCFRADEECILGPASVDVIALQIGPGVAVNDTIGIGHRDYEPVKVLFLGGEPRIYHHIQEMLADE